MRTKNSMQNFFKRQINIKHADTLMTDQNWEEDKENTDRPQNQSQGKINANHHL